MPPPLPLHHPLTRPPLPTPAAPLAVSDVVVLPAPPSSIASRLRLHPRHLAATTAPGPEPARYSSRHRATSGCPACRHNHLQSRFNSNVSSSIAITPDRSFSTTAPAAAPAHVRQGAPILIARHAPPYGAAGSMPQTWATRYWYSMATTLRGAIRRGVTPLILRRGRSKSSPTHGRIVLPPRSVECADLFACLEALSTPESFYPKHPTGSCLPYSGYFAALVDRASGWADAAAHSFCVAALSSYVITSTFEFFDNPAALDRRVSPTSSPPWTPMRPAEVHFLQILAAYLTLTLLRCSWRAPSTD
ncbi:hypothetical protein HK405_012448 [Cladochytrium tenue]|nr:hypothetical protein HK405_012448 [Cladochytrium tenue]